jgi:hypothetical protein
MAKTMNASVTDGQIEDLIAKFRAALVKKRGEISSETFQQILGVPNIGMELFAVLRAHAEKFSEQIVRTVESIDRSLADADAVKAAGLKFYGNIDHSVTLPKDEGDSEQITFIPLEKYMSPDEVDVFVADNGWQYASFKGLCKHNQDNPDFAKNTPHFTQGTGEEKRHSYAAFSNWGGERGVRVLRCELHWDGGCFVAVVPAS